MCSDFSRQAIAHCRIHGRFSLSDSPYCPDCEAEELTDEEFDEKGGNE